MLSLGIDCIVVFYEWKYHSNSFTLQSQVWPPEISRQIRSLQPRDIINYVNEGYPKQQNLIDIGLTSIRRIWHRLDIVPLSHPSSFGTVSDLFQTNWNIRKHVFDHVDSNGVYDCVTPWNLVIRRNELILLFFLSDNSLYFSNVWSKCLPQSHTALWPPPPEKGGSILLK